MPRSNELSGFVAMITGSSTGIGAAIAERLACQGASIILHGRGTSTDLDQTADRLRRYGPDVRCLHGDFSEADRVEQFAHEAWLVHQKLHIVINNAGGDVLTGAKSDWSPREKLDYLYAVDCRATFLISRILGAKMKSLGTPSGHCCIINIGWDQAWLGMGGDSGEFFSAIKGGVMSLTLSLAQSLAPEVRVNCVAPGWIQTLWGTQTTEYWNRRAEGESLMNRWGTPQDVANAVAFLASPQASFISGQILNVNGGFRSQRREQP